jgi:hypothetical protein
MRSKYSRIAAGVNPVRSARSTTSVIIQKVEIPLPHVANCLCSFLIKGASRKKEARKKKSSTDETRRVDSIDCRIGSQGIRPTDSAPSVRCRLHRAGCSPRGADPNVAYLMLHHCYFLGSCRFQYKCCAAHI